MIHFNGGGARAEERFGAVHRCQHHGGISAIVARGGVLLLIAGVVLFVHDNES